MNTVARPSEVFLTAPQVRMRYGGISRHGPLAVGWRRRFGISASNRINGRRFWKLGDLESRGSDLH